MFIHGIHTWEKHSQSINRDTFSDEQINIVQQIFGFLDIDVNHFYTNGMCITYDQLFSPKVPLTLNQYADRTASDRTTYIIKSLSCIIYMIQEVEIAVQYFICTPSHQYSCQYFKAATAVQDCYLDKVK